MSFNPKAPMTLAAMRATLLDDQRELNCKVLDRMNLPRTVRRGLGRAQVAIAQRLIQEMSDADVRVCFKMEGEAR